MLKFIGKHILTGLVAILPVVVTAYLLYWLAVSIESALGDLIRLWLPEERYWPGMGLVTGLAFAFAIGLLMHAYVVRRLFSMSEALFYRTPVIKSIYPALRDFLNYFSTSKKKEFDQVVAVTLGETGMQVLGFVTQANPEHLPEDFRADDNVLVYLPLSYMIGGYAVLMPRSAVRPVDMNMEEAMRFTLTAGVTGATSPGTRQ
ncbi:MAG: DUF502 domain-containing protein [Thiohalobacterales bacterium]|nr:DUF502 domain-containing protein [Thiohalobacterales bacterium]